MKNVRRPRGEGGITESDKRGKHYFVASVSGGRDALGRRIRLQRWCETRAEATKALREMEREIEDGATPKREALRVTEYLSDWLASLTIRESSVVRYGYCVANVTPYLKQLRISEFCTSGDGVEKVQSLYRAMRRAGASDSKVHKAHTMLSAAFSDAVPRYLKGNPCLLVPKRQKPKQNSPIRTIYSVDELQRFAEAIVGEPLSPLYALAFSLLREGEIFALERADVDLAHGRISISKTRTQDERGALRNGPPKSRHGVRTVPLSPFAIDCLRVHLGPADLLLRGASGLKLLFPNAHGQPWDRTNFLKREFYPLLERAGLPRITFHDLRHSVATLLAKRIPPFVLKEMLGHGSLSMTVHYAGHKTEGDDGISAVLAEFLPYRFGRDRLDIGWTNQNGTADAP